MSGPLTGVISIAVLELFFRILDAFNGDVEAAKARLIELKSVADDKTDSVLDSLKNIKD